MNILIPAAGKGTRLVPHTLHTPKVLLPVAGKPIIGHIFDRLEPLRPEVVTIIVNPRQAVPVRVYLAEHYPYPLRFVEQSEPLGLGHAVLSGLLETDDGPVVILLGDTIFELDGREMTGSGNRIGVRSVDDPRRFGIVEVDEGRITAFVEKPEQPRSNCAIVGIYSIHETVRLRETLERLVREKRTTRDEFQLTDALQAMLEQGSVFTPFPVERWLDCGTVEALLETNRHLLKRTEPPSVPASTPTTVIIPPVVIDPSSRIAFSTVGPCVAVGARAVIEHSVVRDSIVDADAVIITGDVEHAFVGKGERIEGSNKGSPG